MSGEFFFEIGDISYRFDVMDLARVRASMFESMWCADRVSDLFVARMLGYVAHYGIDISEITREIAALEGQRISSTKNASGFRNLPLRGLMHKHFTSARFLAANMLSHLGRNGMATILADEITKSGSAVFTKEILTNAARRITTGAIEARHAAGAMTGEWIVYLPHRGANYYLTLTTHGSGDQKTFDEIIAMCSVQFPDLATWIGEAQP